MPGSKNEVRLHGVVAPKEDFELGAQVGVNYECTIVAMGKSRHNRQVSKFNGLHPTPITIAYYLQRIAQFSGCSDQCFVLMLIYIDRLVTKKNIALDAYNVHRLIISAILLSAKFFDDHFYFNPHFALVGGLKEREMNTLELEFLFLIEFNLYVTAEDYQTYYNTLARMAHTRFMNKTLPPIPNIPHKEENLPKPMPSPERRIPLEDDDFVPIRLPDRATHVKSVVKEEDRQAPRYAEPVNYSQQNYGHQQGPVHSNGHPDQQWVHVSSAEVSNPNANYVNPGNSFHDFTIVNKSPEEYEYAANHSAVNMQTAAYPYVRTNNHHVGHNGMVPGPAYPEAVLNNGYVQQYQRNLPHPAAYSSNFGYGMPVQKHASQVQGQEAEGAEHKPLAYQVPSARNAK